MLRTISIGEVTAMSTVTSTRDTATLPPRPDVIAPGEKASFLAEFHNHVARRAYDIFEHVGRTNGDDISHWLQAEGEFAKQLPEVSESGQWLTLSLPLSKLPAERIRVCVEQDRVVISAEDKTIFSRGSHESSSYYLIRWIEPVDPESAGAHIDKESLVVSARKAGSSLVSSRSAYRRTK